jgi:predicted outer membrane protein/methionine-rich copper-binding protein CopC
MRGTAVLAVLVAAACSDRGAGITAPGDARLSTAVVPGIAIGADSNPVTVARGTSATVNVRVARVAGFTGAVTLSVDTAGVARGVRASIANATIAANDTAARAVTITVDTTATASTTPTSFRIMASGTGVTTQMLLMQVIVANQTPGFTFGFAGTTTGSSVVVGQSGTVRVVLRRTGGFTGPVTFTADTAGLPRGVTITQGATAGDTVTLNIAAGTTAAAGAYNVTLRGTGTGVTAQTLTLPLTVAPVGTFTVAGPTTAPSGTTGSTVSIPITITRAGGFTGPVTFTATGAPTGVTVAFDSTAGTTGTTGGTATLRLTLPANLAAGTYPITVRATTPGLAAQTTTINLTVSGSNVTIGQPTNQPIVLAGTSNIINVPLSRPATVSANIAIVANDLPTGLTVTTSSTTTSTGAAAAVVVTAEADVPAGTYPVTLNATDANGGTATSTFNVTVVRNNPSFGFQFAPAPTTPVSVVQGGTTTTSVELIRISTLAPDAILNVSNVSRGLIVTLDRERSAEGTVGVRILASPEALPGVYQFTVQGATVRGNIPPVTYRVQVTAGPTPTQILPATANDANIFALLHESNLGEIMAGTIALQRALNAEVRSFAQMMIAMHNVADTAGQNLALRLGVSPVLPDSTLPRIQQAEMATLAATPAGPLFDRVYISQQIVAHRRTLALIDASIPRAQRAELRAFLQDVVRPAVAAHLEQALQIQSRIGTP